MKKIIILSIIVCSILFFVPEKMYKEIFISICTKIISPPILPSDTDPEISCEIFIAHAGGVISKNTYTNSKEAVLNSLQNGFKYIELDLLVTKDNHIIAAHDWSFITKKNNNTPLTLNEVVNIYKNKNMTLLTGKDIHELMLKNKDWILITDKIKDFSLLEREIPVKNRIIVEVFNKFDYAVCLWKGFTPAYSLPWDSKNLKDLNDFTAEWYTVPGIAWDKQRTDLMNYIKKLRQQKKEVLLYTAGKPDYIDMESDIFIKKNIKMYFSKIYTDMNRSFSHI